jgi:hypothetical protein
MKSEIIRFWFFEVDFGWEGCRGIYLIDFIVVGRK